MSIESLKAQLTEAKQAYHNLVLGKAIVSFSKNGRATTFTQANKSELKAYIDELETAINGTSTRRKGPARFSL